ncbi:MAG: tRNA (guanosine(46)-N7)-methyltransferase TrmB [Cyclobacteriaceae bacterium]|nr:tRNA (guanosine(46)-N7)-methyltransferase TrmB [Cyclobacteriaceae bacterium]MCB0499300.1 tRNA (guanosine(46)-N7)-methyltransferase TrmB [Cyclobacteriaceae bacterium]MCB9236378.1 tRNA (guanosine(46)-N7)-methyltransferase TrmB [Flammeovirgaceae bacterium]MCO5272303.1 tRNA (guanosine(46)-N7)-methyltransferase TrmB [Cyclobacteriaceae bacterium]MCW5902161.1 tRNA (guanosine(46)-N7)-methyltransferase TrmB [Cyclobacteriaceae bacterium]
MKSKLARFKVIAERENVLEPGKELYFAIKGNWNKCYFKNENPITLELACGRGEYSVGMAAMFPDRNFVGVDIKGDRIWKGSTWAVEQNLANVAFLRAQIHTIGNFFNENEVDEIWLTFPDPRPKKRDVKRRLSNNWFFDLYKKILKPGGIFRLKTDNTGLFEFTLDELRQRNDIDDLKTTFDVYQSEFKEEVMGIKTRYEEMFAQKGESIKYLRFRFKG